MVDPYSVRIVVAAGRAERPVLVNKKAWRTARAARTSTGHAFGLKALIHAAHALHLGFVLGLGAEPLLETVSMSDACSHRIAIPLTMATKATTRINAPAMGRPRPRIMSHP